jgi:hypothetical protein
MQTGMMVLAFVSTLGLLGCHARSQATAEAEDPCFVVSAPLESMVISCHPTPSAGECSFRVDRERGGSSVHVASLAGVAGSSCLDRAHAHERDHQPERKTCPAGTRLVRGDCVPS